MKKIFTIALIALIALTGCTHGVTSTTSETPQYADSTILTADDLVRFEEVRDSLYDCAFQITIDMAKYEGSCFYEDVDPETREIILTYKVPGLNVLLQAVEAMEYNSCLYDFYDDIETVNNFYKFREAYYSYFCEYE